MDPREYLQQLVDNNRELLDVYLSGEDPSTVCDFTSGFLAFLDVLKKADQILKEGS